MLILETVPSHLDVIEMKKVIKKVVGVKGVHDLHVWSLNNDKLSFTCQITIGNDLNGK